MIQSCTAKRSETLRTLRRGLKQDVDLIQSKGPLMEIKISAKAFAEFVLGGASKKASTVKYLLKPQSTEAQNVIRYYSRAVQNIRGYHDAENDDAFLRAEIRGLEKKAETAESNQART